MRRPNKRYANTLNYLFLRPGYLLLFLEKVQQHREQQTLASSSSETELEFSARLMSLSCSLSTLSSSGTRRRSSVGGTDGIKTDVLVIPSALRRDSSARANFDTSSRPNQKVAALLWWWWVSSSGIKSNKEGIRFSELKHRRDSGYSSCYSPVP